MILMLSAPIVAVLLADAPPAPCAIAGKVTSASLPLPGVALIVSDGAVDVATSSTDLDGAYRIVLPAAGRYVLKSNLAGFADGSEPIELTAEACAAQRDFTMTLKSRVVVGRGDDDDACGAGDRGS